MTKRDLVKWLERKWHQARTAAEHEYNAAFDNVFEAAEIPAMILYNDFR